MVVPVLAKSPALRSVTLLPAISAPVGVRSPAIGRRRYTVGTRACTVLPSGNVTALASSHAMSVVSKAICSADRATPGVSWYCCAYITPASISAANSSSVLL